MSASTIPLWFKILGVGLVYWKIVLGISAVGGIVAFIIYMKILKGGKEIQVEVLYGLVSGFLATIVIYYAIFAWFVWLPLFLVITGLLWIFDRPTTATPKPGRPFGMFL